MVIKVGSGLVRGYQWLKEVMPTQGYFRERDYSNKPLTLYMEIYRLGSPVVSFYSHPHLIFLHALPNMNKIVSMYLLLVPLP